MLTGLAGSLMLSAAAGVRMIPASPSEGNTRAAGLGRMEGVNSTTASSPGNISAQPPDRQATGEVGRTLATDQNLGFGARRSPDGGGHSGKEISLGGLVDLDAGLSDPMLESDFESAAVDGRPHARGGLAVSETFAGLAPASLAGAELGGSMEGAPTAGNRFEPPSFGPAFAPAGNADEHGDWKALLSFLAVGVPSPEQPSSVSGVAFGGKSGTTPPPPDLGPQAINQQATTDENTPVNIYWLTYGDTDPNGARLTITAVTAGANGAAVLNADGTVTYTPATNWYGTDTFTYTVSNGMGGTATANVSVTVNHVKPTPTATSQNLTTNQNTPLTVTLSGSDVEGASLSFFVEDDPTNGTLSAVADNNTVTYVPNGNFHGTDTFTYEATDGVLAGLPATVTITVNPVVPGPGVTITQIGGSTQVSQFDYPGENVIAAQYTVVLNTQPTANVVVTSVPNSQLSVTPATLTFTSANWSIPQTIMVSALDDQIARPEPDTAIISHTATSTDPNYNGIAIASVAVSVTQANFPGIYFDPQSDPIILDERGQTSAIYMTTLSSKPAANVTVALTGGSRVMLSPSTLIFTPDTWDTPQAVTVQAIHDGVPEGYQEVDIQHIASSVDPQYQGVTASLPLHIIDADNPNAIPPDDATADEGGSVTVSVLANAIDPQGSVLTATSVEQPSNGTATLNADGTVTYTPMAFWSGTDSFTYTIANAQGQQDTGVASVEVLPVNDAPSVTNPGPQNNAEDDQVTLQITASDRDQDLLLYQATGLPPGLVIDSNTGRIWGWIDARGHGTYNTAVTVDDLAGGTTTVSFPWTVAHVNHPPHLFHNHTFISHVGGYQGGIPGPQGSDIDGDSLSYTATGIPPGMIYDPLRNTYSGTPQAAGFYQVSDTADDGHGGTDQDTFQWRVLPAGPQPSPLAFLYVGNSGNNDVAQTLAYPPTPIQATVYLSWLADPTTFTVALDAPTGGAVVSPATVTLHNGQTAQVTVTPTSVSQKVDDVVIRASIDGVETDRVWLTNIGVVLPERVRAPDSPQGMVNRISLGASNLGTYEGAVSIYPNLMGLYSPSLQVLRPQPDDKYGNATVISSNLSVGNHFAVKVAGTVQTAMQPPGADPDNLRLAFVIPAPGGSIAFIARLKFAVAAIPVAVKATAATKVIGDEVKNDQGVAWGRIFAVKYNLVIVSDSGNALDLLFVLVKEDIITGQGNGELGKKKIDAQGAWEYVDTGDDLTDSNGDYTQLFSSLAEARKKYKERLKSGKVGKGVQIQNQRYYNSILEQEPKKVGDAKVIAESGFQIVIQANAKKGTLNVERTPFANRGSEKGYCGQSRRREYRVRYLISSNG